MNGYSGKRSLKSFFFETIAIGGNRVIIIKYLYHLRRYEYYYNTQNRSLFHKIMMVYEHFRLEKLAIKTGFSMGRDSLGYGILIPHIGTIVVNCESKVGPFSVLHTCTCIAGGGKKMGRALYLSTGSQIVGEFNLGDNVTIAAHSLVNRSCGNNVLLAGAPAIIKKTEYNPWYVRDGGIFRERVKKVMELKTRMNIK